ncbi:38830_t:CDS:2 [Gigaspora margarita]|uniref:38830_t:CDS:1 n=1 Tax=Gigaspora margarita TaxID=4874 RepID=A0ABN7WB16_GIGMA|nr:38830_t:CDS:2 [Gigaspora margarita]
MTTLSCKINKVPVTAILDSEIYTPIGKLDIVGVIHKISISILSQSPKWKQVKVTDIFVISIPEHLGGCSIGNEAIEEIACNCTNLKYLNLEEYKGINKKVIKKLNSKIKIKHPDYSDDKFSVSDLPPLIPDPLRVSRSVIFTGGSNRMVSTNTLNVTNLISAIRVLSELTDSE